VREYSALLLQESGEGESARDGLLAWSVGLAEQADEGLWGANASHWTERLEVEVENIRAALRWALESGAAVPGLRLGTSLGLFWLGSGYVTEGRRWLAGLLSLPGSEHVPLRVDGLITAGRLAYPQGDDSAALSLGTEALELAREANDRKALGRALAALGFFEILPGRLSQAGAHLQEAVELSRESGDRRSVEDVLARLAMLESGTDLGAARRYAEQCIALCRKSGNLRALIGGLQHVASIEKMSGNYESSLAVSQESLRYGRLLGSIVTVSIELRNIGACLLAQGEYDRARFYLEEALATARVQEIYTAYTLVFLAELNFAEGDNPTAEHYFEEALQEMGAGGNDDLFIQQRTTLGLGNVALARGDCQQALAYHQKALRLARDHEGILDCVEGIAHSIVGLGQYEQAVVITAAADRARNVLGIPLPAYRRTLHAQGIEKLRATVLCGRFEQTWAEGTELSLTDAASRALKVAESFEMACH
jgi:tetratricopeptide (TPR) repeat protein